MATEYKFSDFDPISSPSLTDEVVGLSDGENARMTLDGIRMLFEANIVDVDPLPAGQPARVMYVNPVDGEWGASLAFVTDGYVVSIGNQTPQADTLLNIESYNDGYNNLINAYTKDLSDTIDKSLVYTNRGVLMVTEGGVPTNIDNPTAATNYGVWVEKGIVAQEHLFLNNVNDSKIKFGDVHFATGAFTEASSLGYLAGRFTLKTAVSTALDVEGGEVNIFGGFSMPSRYRFVHAVEAVNYYNTQVQNTLNVFSRVSDSTLNGVLIGAGDVTEGLPLEYNASLLITPVGDGALLTVTNNPDWEDATGYLTDIFFKIAATGNFEMRLPTSAGGTPNTTVRLWWDSGTGQIRGTV